MTGATLYGSPLSLYTGRARSYLIKAGIEYQETTPTSAHFKNTVLPKMGGRQSVPVLELASGEVLRDGAAIIEYFESQNNHGFSPSTPKQNIISRLFDVIGAEGLLRPAMHYRWNFDGLNNAFLQFHFETFIPPGMDRKAMAAASMNRMRSASASFGAVPANFSAIENLYCRFLNALDDHFSEQPYLLGSKPSMGDFGLIAPLYGHLGRDPAPLALMQQRAVHVFRWVERMNRPDMDAGEFADQSNTYHSNDSIPASLIHVLKTIAEDFVPETTAACDAINQWIKSQPRLAANSIVERATGSCTFELANQQITALAQPYRFYLLQRVQAAYDALSTDDKANLDKVLEQCEMQNIMQLKLDRQIGRSNNREVWL